jgi:hypothetical protein
MTISHFIFRYQLLPGCKARNRLDKAQSTVALKLNPTSFPKTRRISFSGVLFWFFFAQAKKNIYINSINESGLFQISDRPKSSKHK